LPAVLIADNDHAVCSLLVEVLVRRGLDVGQVSDGEAALAAVRDPSVRVLVCDLDMPRASGLEVLAGLGAGPTAPAAIVISGYLDAALHERLAALPAVRTILRKPFDLLAFADEVCQLVATHPVAVDTPPA
jgi:CheY-like chemotaxis protein